MSFRPYLFFGGNCREAFTGYQEIFGRHTGGMRLDSVDDLRGICPRGPRVGEVAGRAAQTELLERC